MNEFYVNKGAAIAAFKEYRTTKGLPLYSGYPSEIDYVEDFAKTMPASTD